MLTRVLLSDRIWGAPPDATTSSWLEMQRWRVGLILGILASAHAEKVPWPAMGPHLDAVVEYVLDQESAGLVNPLDHPIPWFAGLWKHALQVSAERVQQPALLSRLWARAIDA